MVPNLYCFWNEPGKYSESVSLDGGALASWNLYQNAIFQPVLNMISLAGVITTGDVVLSKVFSVVYNQLLLWQTARSLCPLLFVNVNA